MVTLRMAQDVNPGVSSERLLKLGRHGHFALINLCSPDGSLELEDKPRTNHAEHIGGATLLTLLDVLQVAEIAWVGKRYAW